MQRRRYTCSDEKAARNLRLHRVALEDAIRTFDGPTLERATTGYPEERWYAVGLMEGRPVTVIYTDVDERTRRIISAWKAERHEHEAYFAHFEAED